MQYYKAYDARLEGFDVPVFPRIVQVLNTLIWTQNLYPSKIEEIVGKISPSRIELKRTEHNIQTSDGNYWSLGFFHSVKYSCISDSAILFPYCQKGENKRRSIATYLRSTLAGNRRYAVEDALGNLLIDLLEVIVDSICFFELRKSA